MKNKINKCLQEFNKYMSPEATAKLISVRKNSFTMNFSGHFCETCGFYDYFDDFKILLEKLELKVKISKVEEKEQGALVEFKIQEDIKNH
ncbi:MAG: hypothetical protein COY38_03375 [Candidatus Aenigmarchaeota archaeon CG_4_10_14_0_8_um_filter_37_24]|nr:hypothetical protein [Candidatus Aenigmarchaeota archaeon]OIN87037.1 MAG: hypothetical protein AUJ50_03250 [Candidatus Aenigmarchaeota archaeon CG1_02_38_14]PIV69020.1 MAG: hypothetical protein COS07_02190 [Candidatus Aenigmarchaeota archaeon CG01_land_8_20_14_3_00_37_9]PIX50885.1 MAG: hypothetical protein COZ52_01780 [Candidatus Aenigmarchaeota archaeon CG_4_8_14_3_um_filter_37_24]PIZ34922.1 MAG: hypothetical protein COY38_03375 [Candidatus Aenigmarchaeota archaeon CG_4_10_14_0_8_um_filter_